MNDDRFPKPKGHPTDNHAWNVDWKAYCLNQGIKIKDDDGDDSEEGYEEEEEE